MKKVTFTLALLLLGGTLSAQTVTCSVSGATTKQANQFTAFLAGINAQRTAQGQSTFTGFPDYCAFVMLTSFQSWIAAQNQVDAAKVGSASNSHGDEIATNAQCAAASLANGCSKNQVACFVLTGNTACN